MFQSQFQKHFWKEDGNCFDIWTKSDDSSETDQLNFYLFCPLLVPQKIRMNQRHIIQLFQSKE